MTFVFLHGGPGANSFAEQVLLGPFFRAMGCETTFWNEPSSLRPDGEPFAEARAFERWLASAERHVLEAARSGPVHLIAHSFTPHAVEIARRHPEHVSTLVLAAPGADPFVTYRNVLKLGHEDLLEEKPDIASAIAQSLDRTRAVMDEAMQTGLLNVLHDERLFSHYWADAGQMRASMAARQQPEAQFDVKSFFAVLSDFAQRSSALLSASPVVVPTLVLFGASDRVTPVNEQRMAVQAAVPDALIEVFDDCSHNLHLDRPQFFVERVVGWAGSCNASSRA